MSQAAAIGAMCAAVSKGEIHADGAPIQLSLQNCEAENHNVGSEMWSVTAPGFWCLPFGESQTIYFDFSDKDHRLTRISAYCPAHAL
jgi:hypothetical protein